MPAACAFLHIFRSIFELFGKDIGENIYELKSRFTGEVLIDNFTLHLKNIAYYRDLYYTKGEKCPILGRDIEISSMWNIF